MSPIKGIFVFTALAFAAVAAGPSSRVTFARPTVIAGQELTPGDYRIEWNGEKATIKGGKQTVEATVKVETGNERFANTAIRYDMSRGKAELNELWIGGTKTKLIFMDQSGGAAARPAVR